MAHTATSPVDHRAGQILSIQSLMIHSLPVPPVSTTVLFAIRSWSARHWHVTRKRQSRTHAWLTAHMCYEQETAVQSRCLRMVLRRKQITTYQNRAQRIRNGRGQAQKQLVAYAILLKAHVPLSLAIHGQGCHYVAFHTGVA
jgi:hypothetical protein